MGNILGGSNIIQTSTNFDTNIVQQAVTEFTQGVYQSIASSIVSTVNVTFDGNKLRNCDVNLIVSNTINDFSRVSISTENYSQVKNTQSVDVTNQIAKQLQQQNENLGLGKNSISDAVSINNFINETIRNTFDQSTTSIFTSSITEGTNATVYLSDCIDSTINLNVSNIINMRNEVQIKQVLDAMVENDQVTKILNDYKLTVKQTNSISSTFLLSFVAAILGFTLIPFIPSIIEATVSFISEGKVSTTSYINVSNMIKVLYMSLGIFCLIYGFEQLNTSPIDWITVHVVTILVLFFTLMLFFG